MPSDSRQGWFKRSSLVSNSMISATGILECSRMDSFLNAAPLRLMYAPLRFSQASRALLYLRGCHKKEIRLNLDFSRSSQNETKLGMSS